MKESELCRCGVRAHTFFVVMLNRLQFGRREIVHVIEYLPVKLPYLHMCDTVHVFAIAPCV